MNDDFSPDSRETGQSIASAIITKLYDREARPSEVPAAFWELVDRYGRESETVRAFLSELAWVASQAR